MEKSEADNEIRHLKLCILCLLTFLIVPAGCQKQKQNNHHEDSDFQSLLREMENEQIASVTKWTARQKQIKALTKNEIAELYAGMTKDTVVARVGTAPLSMGTRQDKFREISFYNAITGLSEYPSVNAGSIKCIPVDNLFPLVFCDNELAGWDWSFVVQFIDSHPEFWDDNWCTALNLYTQMKIKDL